MNDTPDPTRGGRANGGRRRALLLVLGAFSIAGIGFAAWWFASGRYYETTDDAYVGGNLVQITPQVAGTVVAIDADDTDFVKAGQTLVELDKSDSRVALEQSEAQLAKTVRSVRNLVATTAELEANVALRRSDLEKARQDLGRRQQLEADVAGALSAEELQHARDAVANAEAALAAAREQLAAQRTLVEGTTVETHPEVRNAAAKVREAYLAYARTALPAPVSGFVARRSVQLGQRVSSGTPLMTVVPLEQVWVDANFKEGQLENLRAGQPVRLVADAYGGAVAYHGKVAGFSAGTGSAFALLPAQNATGNWIKVVQRVPVRIVLDPAEIAKHPLRLGLSMLVDIDTHQLGGEHPSGAKRAGHAYQTKVYASLTELADRRIAAIIAANGGNAGAARRAAEAAGGALRPESGAR